MKRADGTSLDLSVLIIGELEKGIAKQPLSFRRTKKIETWVKSDLVDRFRERLLAIDGTVAATWGKLAGEAEARGEPLAVINRLIIATGIANDLIIAIRNIGDFKRCGASCFNPWMQS
jgi:predicted nucleic acid-binding protein